MASLLPQTSRSPGWPVEETPPERSAVLWYPDWPVHAARLEAERRGQASSEEGETQALVDNHTIVACGSKARAQGIRRGMALRAAQALYPSLQVETYDEQRDGRVFATIVQELDSVAASVEVLRPGLVAVNALSAARFYGGEDEALERLMDAASHRGIDVTVGVANEITTAILAARHHTVGAVVGSQQGASLDFVAQQPLSVLLDEPALDCDRHTVELLSQVGVSTLGDLAQLDSKAVSTRFGAAGAHCHAIATAQRTRRVTPHEQRADLSATIRPEEAITRVDEAAFIARMLAFQVHQRLARHGVSCVRIKIAAETDSGEMISKVWRTTRALSEQATADRVRWQLDGWLSSGGTGALTELSLIPLETQSPETIGSTVSTTTGVDDERLSQVLARLQSVLGIEAVLQPHLVGGRGVAERIDFVPYGQPLAPEQVTYAHQSWPGRIPAPLPARLGGGPCHPASRVRIVDRNGEPVIVTAEALLSAPPAAMAWGPQRFRILGWAGPWPVDTAWWENGGEQSQEKKLARIQVVGHKANEDHPCAWLLVWSRRQWRIEAMY